MMAVADDFAYIANRIKQINNQNPCRYYQHEAVYSIIVYKLDENNVAWYYHKGNKRYQKLISPWKIEGTEFTVYANGKKHLQAQLIDKSKLPAEIRGLD